MENYAFGMLMVDALDACRYLYNLIVDAYFAFTAVLGLGIPWRHALGAVFLSGLLNLLISSVGIREQIIQAIGENSRQND